MKTTNLYNNELTNKILRALRKVEVYGNKQRVSFKEDSAELFAEYKAYLINECKEEIIDYAENNDLTFNQSFKEMLDNEEFDMDLFEYDIEDGYNSIKEYGADYFINSSVAYININAVLKVLNYLDIEEVVDYVDRSDFSDYGFDYKSIDNIDKLFSFYLSTAYQDYIEEKYL